ncbi:MAG: hypothetical protein OER88_12655, partial [Planctomycetota bacterium]|nr:hypothetical protein [Planctomycetota bacterium]
ILYLPLYPDDEGVVFNESVLLRSPNALATLCPGDAAHHGVVRVIEAAAIAPGRTLRLAMDGETQEALCYLL